jgi:hypothetical protein
MSVETTAWAKEQQCGCPYAKAVLLELANWARPSGICEFRRVRDIASVVEVSERTVQRSLKLLETKPKDGGLGLIRRIAQHRDDGGQQANRFELVGYIRRGDYQSPPNDKQSSGGRLPVRGRSDTPVTPNMNQESNQKDSPQSPRSQKRLRMPITPDWEVPSVQQLPTSARSLAGQWPPEAYETEAEAYHQYWQGTGQRRADWNALWASRVQSQHERVMRCAKAESTGSAHEPEVRNSSRKIAPPPHAKAQIQEDGRSACLRQKLRERVGEQRWAALLAPAAYIFDLPGLKVFVSTEAAQQVIETQFSGMLRSAAQSVDPNVTWVLIQAEPPQLRRAK